MDRLFLACIQQRMRFPATLDEYREDLRRFMTIAVQKRAQLVVLPEMAGTMAALPILAGFGAGMIKQAHRGQRATASLWQRATGVLAGQFAQLLKVNLRRNLAALLDVEPGRVWEAYVDVFGGLARQYSVTLVAPSAYLPDPIDGVIRNLAVVFGRDGEVLGAQAKVILSGTDGDLARAGATWDVIHTDVGALGVILGSDVLYPEVGRLLAYQGAEILICQAACADPAAYHKIRAGVLARMQDNQLFAAVAFLVGTNELTPTGEIDQFYGKSAIFAPQELTAPRFNGVLVEMGAHTNEGVLTAEWDFLALRELWEKSETPVRQQIPLEQAGRVLAQLYSRLQALPQHDDSGAPAAHPQLAPPRPSSPGHPFALDDLPIIASVTSRWPLIISDDALDESDPVQSGSVQSDPVQAGVPAAQLTSDMADALEGEPEDESEDEASAHAELDSAADGDESDEMHADEMPDGDTRGDEEERGAIRDFSLGGKKDPEDETDEMDVLDERPSAKG